MTSLRDVVLGLVLLGKGRAEEGRASLAWVVCWEIGRRGMAAMLSLVQPSAAFVAPATAGIGLQKRNSSECSSQGSLVSCSWHLTSRIRRGASRRVSRMVVRSQEEGLGSAAGAGGDSVVSEVAVLEDEPDTQGVGNVATKVRKPSPLQKGGTLEGEQAEGKDPSASTLGKARPLRGPERSLRIRGGGGERGTSHSSPATERLTGMPSSTLVVRRKWLEDNPEASSNSEPVLFETSTVPWWAWVKRFHLPEAELLNGRAAMLGYAAAYLVDSATGVGLVDQSNSFFGKLLLFITVVGVLLIRKNSDLANLQNLADESTFYDKQWQATWKDAGDAKKTDKP